jgi:Tol biopolymer transport system component
MSTDGRPFLVVGDIAARQVRTLAQGVECPTLSPDDTPIAFNHAIGRPGQPDPGQGSHAGHDGAGTWRLSTLDLATMQVTHLTETRSVDDRAVWLDGRTLAYSLQRSDGTNDVWAVPADGSGAPRPLIHKANSPAPPASAP